jgi:hypothetical protein
MKKETIVAIILGVFLGGMVALTFVLSTKEKAIKSKKIISPKITPTIKISAPKIKPLEITEPAQDYLSNENTVILKGQVEKGSLIIIQSPTSEKVIKTTTNNFSISFPLSLGENLIKVISYQKNNIEEKTLKVYYLKE